MGVSRDSFYRFRKLYDAGGEVALQEASSHKPILKNRVEESVETAIIALAIAQPSLGPVRVSNELKQRGMSVSSAGVRCVWLRHDLKTIQKRRKAQEASAAQPKTDLSPAS